MVQAPRESVGYYWRDYAPDLVAQRYLNNALLGFMRAKGNIKEINGGQEIAVGVVKDLNSTFQWYSGAEAADTSEQDPFTRAFYPWALARTAITATDEDLDKNLGDKHRLHVLIDELIENAERSMDEKVSTALHGSNSTNAKQMLGLGNFIASTAQTIGRIDSSVETWWDSQRVTSGVTALNLKRKIRSLINDVNQHVPAPQRDGIVAVTTQAIFEEYEDQVDDIARVTLDSATKERLGFGNADVIRHGRYPIIWDEQAAAQTFKVVNTNFLYLVVHPKRNFSVDPMRTPVDAHWSVSYIRLMGQLVSKFQNAQGGLFSVSV